MPAIVDQQTLMVQISLLVGLMFRRIFGLDVTKVKTAEGQHHTIGIRLTNHSNIWLVSIIEVSRMDDY